MTDNKLKQFQICELVKDSDNKETCGETTVINAVNLSDAYNAAAYLVGGFWEKYRVYPYATPDDGESVLDLAKYARTQFWKWELRNNAAALVALNRSTWDTEDEIQDAALAILAALDENPDMTMFDLYRIAYNVLASNRDRLFRRSEHEYNPAALFCNPFIDRKQIATFPRLASLFARAKDAAELTEKQLDVIELYQHGITAAAVMERMNITKRAYYKLFYKGLYKILAAAVALDGETLDTFTESGIDAAAVAAALAKYKNLSRYK